VRTLLAALVAGALLALAVPAAQAATKGRCVLGEKTNARCFIWRGKAIHVDDGDTMDVDIAGDGTRRTVAVRVTGINATELTRYSSYPRRRRGTCHSREATALMERMVKRSRRRVLLVAKHPSSRSGRRIRRSVRVRAGGRWHDAATTMLREGQALWLPNKREDAWNRQYGRLAQEAAADGTGLYDTDYCGRGPAESSRLRLRVTWDANGDDRENVNGEWVEVANDGPRAVNLSRWTVRQSDLRRFRLPRGTRVGVGERVRVHLGRGRDGGNHFYWGHSRPVFDQKGDGAYLFDPQGDLRAWMIYPCRVGCTDPLRGALRLEAHPDERTEYVTVENTSRATANLGTYTLDFPFHHYEFGPGAVVQPGETLRVDAQGDPSNDTRLHKHAGFEGLLMPNRGGTVRVRSYRDVVVACDAWGGVSC
jgi:hypothetical protein